MPKKKEVQRFLPKWKNCTFGPRQNFPKIFGRQRPGKTDKAESGAPLPLPTNQPPIAFFYRLPYFWKLAFVLASPTQHPPNYLTEGHSGIRGPLRIIMAAPKLYVILTAIPPIISAN